MDNKSKGKIKVKMYREKTWQSVCVGTEENSELFGVKIFTTDFKPTGETISYHNRPYAVYYAQINGSYERFAMAEISNGVYEFLLYKY